MWYDSWDEALAGTRAYGDREGWPVMPADEIPGPRKYLQEHSSRDVLRRLWSGTRQTLRTMVDSCAYFKYALFFFLATLVALLVRPTTTARLVDRQLALVLFLAAYFVGYGLLYAWYVPIADRNRLVLSLFIPGMWLYVRILESSHFEGLSVRVRGRSARRSTIVHGVVLLIVAADVVRIMTDRIGTMYGGD